MTKKGKRTTYDLQNTTQQNYRLIKERTPLKPGRPHVLQIGKQVLLH